MTNAVMPQAAFRLRLEDIPKVRRLLRQFLSSPEAYASPRARQ